MSDENILVEKEKEIINKCNELTGMKIKTLIFRGSKDGFKSKDFHQNVMDIQIQ